MIKMVLSDIPQSILMFHSSLSTGIEASSSELQDYDYVFQRNSRGVQEAMR
jgi:hypothetical protein